METKILLDRLSPYIAPHKHFDITMSKYGPLYVYPVDRKETLYEAEVLCGSEGIVKTVAFQMICDVMEPVSMSRTRPTKEELLSVRNQLQALLSGMDFEDEAMNIVDQYIEMYRSLEW